MVRNSLLAYLKLVFSYANVCDLVDYFSTYMYRQHFYYIFIYVCVLRLRIW